MSGVTVVRSTMKHHRGKSGGWGDVTDRQDEVGLELIQCTADRGFSDVCECVCECVCVLGP